MKKVLIVEDSLLINQHIELCIINAGYEPLTAYNGEEAFRLASSKKPDLVLMDILLDDNMDGVQAATKINSLNQHIPIIYLTANSDKDTIDRAKFTQPFGYIIKPFNEVELVTNIEMAIYKAGIENEIKQNKDILQSTINTIEEGLILISEDLKVDYINPSAEKITGHKFTELLKLDFKSIFSFNLLDDNEISIEPFVENEPYLINKKFGKSIELMMNCQNKSTPVGNILLKPIINDGALKSYLFLFKDITNLLAKRKLEDQLKKKKVSLLIEGQESERARIAQELHDSIGQTLNLVKLKMDLLSKNDGEYLELSALIDESIQEIKKLSENLLPSQLNYFDLKRCIESLIKKYQQTNILVEFKSVDMPVVNHLGTKINLYRITQEAINNAIKHAKASRITVQLNEVMGRAQLTIEDDGHGFDFKPEVIYNHHHGINNMIQRAESLNGVLEIESNKKFGTFISVEVPLQNE